MHKKNKLIIIVAILDTLSLSFILGVNLEYCIMLLPSEVFTGTLHTNDSTF